MRHLHTRSPRGLFTGALYKISSQDLYERSLYKISWYPWTSEMSSLQDLFKRRRSASNTQKVPRGLRGRNQNRHRATARAIRRARTPQRVARAKTKNAPGWAPATFRQQNERGAYSQSDPTRAKSRDGCVCKHKIGTAPQRDLKNHSSDRALTSELQYEMRFFDVLRRKYCACHEKMNPRHTKSCNCHAKWCQHSRSKFDDSFTKRAFRALQDRLQ